MFCIKKEQEKRLRKRVRTNKLGMSGFRKLKTDTRGDSGGVSNQMKGFLEEEGEKEGNWESKNSSYFSALFLLEVNIFLYRKPKRQEKMLEFWRSGSNWKVVLHS